MSHLDATRGRRVYQHSKCGLPIKGHKRGADHRLICNVTVGQPSPEGENHPQKPPFIRSQSEASCLASPPPSPRHSPPPPPPPRHSRGRTPYDRDTGESSDNDNERLTVAAYLTGVVERQLRAPRSPSPNTNSIRRSPSYDLPPVGIWDKERRKKWSAFPTPEEMPRDPSLVPTLLVNSNGDTIREGSRAEAAFATWEEIRAMQKQAARSEQGTAQVDDIGNRDKMDEEVSTSTNPQNPFVRVLRSAASNPLVTAVPARAEDVSRLQEIAAHLGLYTSVLRTPPPSPSDIWRPKDNLGTNGDTARENSWIVVIGRSMELAQQYVEVAQRTMPGTIASDRDLMEGPKMITTFQLIFVSLLSTFFAATVFLSIV